MQRIYHHNQIWFNNSDTMQTYTSFSDLANANNERNIANFTNVQTQNIQFDADTPVSACAQAAFKEISNAISTGDEKHFKAVLVAQTAILADARQKHDYDILARDPKRNPDVQFQLACATVFEEFRASPLNVTKEPKYVGDDPCRCWQDFCLAVLGRKHVNYW